MLEEVGVQALFRHLHVRLDVVGEFLDLQLYAFFRQLWFDEVEDLGVRHRGGGDGKGIGLGREGRDSGSDSKQLLH
ncbi:hypothetical protein D3C80_2112220 [compost metagenome]